MRRALAPALSAAAFALLAPSVAEAAPPSWDEGGYIYLAPGTFAIELDDGDLNWQGGFGGGYMFQPSRHFFVTVGGALSHMVDNLSPNGMVTRLLMEVRLGGGKRFWWIYGRFGPGLGLLYRGNDDVDVVPAFNFRTGPGVQFRVAKHFFVGLEASFEFMVFAGGGISAVGGPRPFIGWHF